MNSLKPFNLSGFNIAGSQNEEVDISIYCYEKYETTINFSKNTLLTVTCNERISNNIKLTLSIPENIDLEADLGVIPKLEFFINLESNFQENILSKIKLAEDINFEIDVNNDFKVSCSVGLNSTFDCNLFENLYIKGSTLGKNILIKDYVNSEELLTNLKSSVLNNWITKVNASGKRIEIDSDKYTVYIDEENALDKFSGDWIYLSRDIEAIEISSSNNKKIKGKIIFRERFL
ncbi:hypothetical protein SAMN00017477_0868 [Peptoniphilus asaccharolyticus DSM 20463]|uniref:Uncharacterized protein n=1 Tax=Peptoniphilus asaccharolyticus DSM 20463 TaxID=573058 RepID=A0A1W1UYS1_PEPAS|nr:hypothetical protein [Peptoniphilus asaccharolyticus]MBL7575362.1 hypothetical protein [Peptoniphilus asaccharolyticus]SMB86258.1 hypothetical protein SAMN00017477_0868 [Peptoniphilus asaccharolyticus DSM 20463]